MEAISAIDGVYDHRGRPALPSTTGGWTAAAMILVVEVCERLTTLGIAVNLVTYLTSTMHMGSAAAATTVTNFLGSCYIFSLLFGFLADTFFGRYLTVAISATIEATGVVILTTATTVRGLRPPPGEKATREQMAVLYFALYITAMGTGGLKSSVSGFGSDQFDEDGLEEKERMVKFFHWFFFFINVGSLLAVTVMVYVQEYVGRGWGYGLSAGAIAVGVLVFLSGTRRYRYRKLVGSPVTQIAAVVVAALRKRKMELPHDAKLLFEVSEEEDETEKKRKKNARLSHSDHLCFLDKAAIKATMAATTGRRNPWILSTVTEVEEVKMVLKMLPIWATTIMFWTIYAQMVTFSVSQAITMDRRLPFSSFQIPAASLTFFFIATILLTIPLYDTLILPFLTNPQEGLTPLQKIGTGLGFSAAAMAVAAAVELRRAHAEEEMGVFWLVPQFFLVGVGEALAYVGQLDFFLRECPEGMKTMSTGLFLSTLSLGFFLSSGLVWAVEKVTEETKGRPWIADGLSGGRLYDFYWLLAGLSAVNLVLYVACARRYLYKGSVCVVDEVKGEEHVGGV